jgi:hypothetical protein
MTGTTPARVGQAGAVPHVLLGYTRERQVGAEPVQDDQAQGEQQLLAQVRRRDHPGERVR